MRFVAIPFLLGLAQVSSVRVQHHIGLGAPQRDIEAVLKSKRSELQGQDLEMFDTGVEDMGKASKFIATTLEAGESVKDFIPDFLNAEAIFTKKYKLPSDLFSAELPREAFAGQPGDRTWVYIVTGLIFAVVIILAVVSVYYRTSSVVVVTTPPAANSEPLAAPAVMPAVNPSVLLQRQASLGQQVADPAMHMVQ